MGTSAIIFNNYDGTLQVPSVAAVAVGDPLIATTGELIGFATGSCTASGVTITYRVEGKCDSVPKSTNDPWAQGQLLWWDNVNLVATRQPTPYFLGFAASAQLVTDTSGNIVMTGPSTGGPNYNIVAPSATLTSWTTFTAFSNGTYLLPANALAAGKRLRIRGLVQYLAVNSTNTFQTIIKFAGTAIITSIARNPTALDVCRFDAVVTIRTSGATGTWIAEGASMDGAIGAAPAVNAYAVESTAIDTTSATANNVVAGAVCSVSNAGNQAILQALSVDPA